MNTLMQSEGPLRPHETYLKTTRASPWNRCFFLAYKYKMTMYNVIKTTRKDGQVPHLRTQPIPIHLNRFARLQEIQDPSPIPRWTPRTFQFHIAYLQQRKATRNKTSTRGISHSTHTTQQDQQDLNISPPEKTTRLQYRQLATTITIPTPTQIGEPTITTLVGGRTTTTRMNTQRTMEEHQISLTEPITLRAGQRVIVNGQHFTLRGIPTIVPRESSSITQETTRPTPPEQNNQNTQTNSQGLTLDSPDDEYASEESVTTYFKCYIPPEIDESNAESVAREEEIQRRIRTRKHKILPEGSRSCQSQSKRVRETHVSTKIEPIIPHVTSLTIDEDEDMGNTPNEQVSGTSLTVPAKHCVEGSSLQHGKERVDLSSSTRSDRIMNLQDYETNNKEQIKQLVQTVTLGMCKLRCKLRCNDQT
jgi:hypothetical protein